MRKQRGLSWVTALIVLAAAGGIFWILTYGEAYWDNIEVNHLLKQAANKCYQEHDDNQVKGWVIRKLHETFDEKVEDHGRVVTVTKIDFDNDDLRLERTQIPAYVNIWFTYNRTVKIPLVGGERTLQFVDHAEQDLSPTKW